MTRICCLEFIEPMELSSQYEAHLRALGKKLVQQLDSKGSEDVLAHWMSHHIAELISEAELATEDKKPKAEARCREAILSVWKQLESLPGERYLFSELREILSVVERIDPEKPGVGYYRHHFDKIESADLSDEARSLLKAVSSIDCAARVIIEQFLKFIMKDVAEANQKWIDEIDEFEADWPVSIEIIRRFVDNRVSEADRAEEKNKKALEILKDRRERLSDLVKHSEELLAYLDGQIATLVSNQSPSV